jgi:KDO2-lipid IV(A) lauroyltransferase
MLLLLRLIAHLPLGVLYAFGGVVHLLAFRVAKLRVAMVDGNLAKAFPDRTPQERAQLAARYRRNITDVAMEVLKGFAISPRELRDRVRLDGLEPVRARLDAGQPVMLVAAHHCNWEWMLLALSLDLGHPLHAIYKPMKNGTAERAFHWLRTRFGGRLTPAKQIVPEILRRKDEVRAIAMLGDQVPTTSPSKFWTKFLTQDTAFYMGGEEIARAAGYPVYAIEMERVARGRYVARVVPLASAGDGLEVPKEVTRRYAQRLEAHIRAHPADWLWSHNRWKLKKPLYAK